MERIGTFDIIKGFGIILMIVAHTYGPGNMLWNFIYTFHIPLFFIVTGYFYKEHTIQQLLTKNIKQLLVPYIAMCFIVVILTQIRHPHNIKSDISYIFNGMGPGWFLLALFLVRISFHYILYAFKDKYLVISLLISTSISIIAYYYNMPSFLSFFPSLLSLFFVAFGYYIRVHSILEHDYRHPIIILTIGILCWLLTSYYGQVEMSQCIFKLSVIDFCGSIGGTYIIFRLSRIIDQKQGLLNKTLLYAGRYSIVILFFHSIDYCVPFWHQIEPFFPSSIFLFVVLAIRFLFVSACVFFTLHSKHLRTFFCIK